MTERRYNRIVLSFALVMCSSFLMIGGVNLSLFFFAYLFLQTVRFRRRAFLRLDSIMKLWVLLFLAGATGSLFSNFASGNLSLFRSSVAVYPNYVYWGLMLLLFTTMASFVALDLSRVFGAVLGGLVSVVIYYLLFQDLIGDDVFFKRFLPNDLSFVMICFTPHAVYWLRKRSLAGSLLFLGAIVLLELLSGRRAGFVLVLAGGASALFVSSFRLSLGGLLRSAALAGVALLLLRAQPVEDAIARGSSRVHELLYEGGSWAETDRSYLTRVAMIEKGLYLFRGHMWFGIGLNNFTKTRGLIEGQFEGAQYVVDKDIFVDVSSHNSYVNILAEGGLALFVPFILILSTLLAGGVRRLNSLNDYEKVILASYCLMCAHLFFTNAIVNSVAWFNAALLAYVVTRARQTTRWQPGPPNGAPNWGVYVEPRGAFRDGSE